MRHLGFVPDDLRRAPHAALATLASQLQVPVSAIDEYAGREQTRSQAPRISCPTCRSAIERLTPGQASA